ncbi:MAG: hypothetical protein KY469_22680 [Actinobacteria bacterium]|nr:hypothetical protein [Actinomycetota bacterium]
MRARRFPSHVPTSQVEARPAAAVVGLRDNQLLAAVQTAIESSGFQVTDVAVTPNQLLGAVSHRRPQLVVAALDVLGEDPGRVVGRTRVLSPHSPIVVLSPLGTVAAWLLEAGAEVVVAQTEIGELRKVLQDLREW